jgi:hypothetical protein
MAVAQGTPFFDITPQIGPTSSDLFPFIYGFSGGQILTIDYRPLVSYGTPSGSAPSPPGTSGDGLQYFTNISNGAPAGHAAQSAAQAAFWGMSYGFAGSSSTYGYPGAGSTAAIPYGAGIPMCLQPSGYIVICNPNKPQFSVQRPVGGVSAATSDGSVAELWVLNPLTCKAVYDIIPVLTGTVGYIMGVFPCADGAHLIVLTSAQASTGSAAADRWHLLSLSASAVTEIANGPWTSGPELMGDPNNLTSLASLAMGSSTTQNPRWFVTAQSANVVGMLESDLSHLWIASSSSQFYVLTLTGGNNYSVLFHGAGGHFGTNPFVQWLNSSEFSTDITIFADKGAAAGMVANLMAYWSYLGSGPQEVDVAKEAIAGDTSWRTIFCGFDVPRFTDLGLASGLTSGGNPVTGSSSVAANAGPYPIYYRKLGVSNPTLAPAAALVPASAGANAVHYLETFDTPTQWTLPPNGPNSGASFQIVGGNPGAYMQVQSIGATEAIAWKNFAVDQSQPMTVETDFSFIRAYNARLNPSTFDFFYGLDSSVSGSVIRIFNQSTGITLQFCSVSNGVIGPPVPGGSFVIASGSIPSWHTDADPTFTGFIQSTQWMHAKAVITPTTGSTTSATIAFTVSLGSTVEFTQTVTGMPIAGPGSGVGTFVPVESYPDWLQMKVDNFQVSGTGPAAATQTLQATTYLYTLVNDLGEESGPSPAMLNTDGSNFITRAIGTGVIVTLPGSLVASGADITYFQVNPGTFIPSVQLNGVTPSPTMNLYRAVTGNQGTQFLLVAANIAFSGGATTTYTDVLPDSALSEIIPSLFTVNGVQGFWSPPPINMVGILALPNQIYAGFHNNVLDLSAQAIPHAWPIIYQLTFDYDIVGIEAIDVSIIVCTKKFPYVCSGNTPDQFSSTKCSYAYACASKRSIKFLKNLGVVYATFEGLVAIASPGQEKVLTEALFSKREWLALNPASMIADINDGRYFCSYTTAGGVKGAFYIDVMNEGSGKVTLGWHFTARYNDPLTDTLYIVPDFVDPAIPIGQALQTICAFEGGGAALPYAWKSKQFYLAQPTCWRQARVQAESYVNTVLTLYADGVLYATIPVTSNREFALPPPSVNGTSPGTINKYFEFGIAGSDFVNRVQFVENSDEWALMA